MSMMGRWEQGEALSQSSLCPLLFFLLRHDTIWNDWQLNQQGPCATRFGCSPSHFLTFFSFSYLFFGPDGDKPQQAGITAQWLNSLRPLHLSARCNGAGCSMVLVGRGRQAVLLCYEAMPSCQGISPHTRDICRGKKAFFGSSSSQTFPAIYLAVFPAGSWIRPVSFHPGAQSFICKRTPRPGILSLLGH